MQFHRITPQFKAFPTPSYAVLILYSSAPCYSIPLHFYSILCPSHSTLNATPPFISITFHCTSFHCDSTAMRFSPILFLCRSTRFPFIAIPSLSSHFLSASMHIDAVTSLCFATLFRYCTYSHRNAPFPELRHCPRPFISP